MSQTNFSKIETFFRGAFRKLLQPDEYSIFTNTTLDITPNHKDLLNSKLPEELINFLLDMDKKLDHIITINEQNRVKEDFPHDLEGVVISGSGISFYTHSRLNLHDYLEIILFLNLSPFRMVSGIGQIAKTQKENDKYLWTLEFTKINEQDLDHIIQFVFQEERKKIRELNWS